MRQEMPSGIPATGAAYTRAQSARILFPLFMRSGTLLHDLYGKGGAVLKMSHIRNSHPRLKDSVGLYVAGDPKLAEASDWWAEWQFEVRGLLFILPMYDAGMSCDYGSSTYLCEELVHGNLQQVINWYMMLSYLYYVHGHSAVPDETFNELCYRLLNEFEATQSLYHAQYLTQDALSATTGFHLGNNVPTVTKYSALQILRKEVVIE